MPVALKRCIFDPKFVKPKCVREVADFFLKNCKQTAKKCKQIFENCKKSSPPLNLIFLTLPTRGRKCIVLKVQPFEIINFDLGHPVNKSVPDKLGMTTFPPP